MRVFFNAIVVQVVLSTYVLWRGWNALPPKKVVRLPFAAIFVVELIVYLIGFFYSSKLNLTYIHNIAWIGTTWMVFILYMSALLIVYDLLRYINKKRPFLSPKIDLGKWRERLIYYLFSLAFVISVMMYGRYKFNNPEVTYKAIQVEKAAKIEKLRIVMASDLHAGYLIKKDVISMYVDKIMEQNPDVILLVGDIIDYDIASVKKQHIDEEFKRLKAPYGVYATTGNHEYIGIEGEEFHEKVTWLSDYAGMTVLRDKTILIDSTFYLVGREDDKYMHRKSLAELIKGIDKSYPIILMNHQPHDIHEASRNNIDLAFYGHTHNGQFFPNNIAVKFIWELPYGYRKIDSSHVYVSSGLGLAGPQYRIATKSEVVVFDVEFKK